MSTKDETVKDAGPLELAPAGMSGWVDEAGVAEALTVGGPGELRIRVVIGHERVVVFALGERSEDARELLERLGFKPECLRRMLCG